MHAKDFIRFLKKLVSLAEEHCRISLGNRNNIEPGFLAVLLYVKNASPELQKLAEVEFAKRVKNLGGYYAKGRASSGLITYCMRGLKFELVRKAAIKAKYAHENAGDDRMSLRSAMDRILAAYEPEWENDIAFDYHRNSWPNPEQHLIEYVTRRRTAKRVAEIIECVREREAQDIFSEDCLIFLKKMIALAEKRSRLCRGDVSALNVAYFAVSTYAKNVSRSLRKKAELEFIRMLEAKASGSSTGKSSYGLITYCMRELKSKSVAAVAMKLKRAPEYSGRRYISFRREMGGIIKACKRK